MEIKKEENIRSLSLGNHTEDQLFVRPVKFLPDCLGCFLIFSELFSIKEYKNSLVNESIIEWNEEKSIIFTVS